MRRKHELVEARFNDDRLVGYQVGDASLFITTIQNSGTLVGVITVGGLDYTVYHFNDRDYYVPAEEVARIEGARAPGAA